MSSAPSPLPDLEAHGGRGEDLRPRSASELLDASFLLLREHAALLVPLATLHVLPLGAALAALLTLPGRAFPLDHPSLELLLLALAGSAALALRPLALAATTRAVLALVEDEVPKAGACLRAAVRRTGPVLGAAAGALAFDLITLGVTRVLGRHHTRVPIVIAEGLASSPARAEARRLARAFPAEHFFLNLAHVFLVVVLFFDLWIGVMLTVFLLKAFFGFELTVASAFVAPGNAAFLLVVFFAALFLLEPLRAVVKALLLLDLRLREEGRDLLIRLARLA